MPARIVVVHDDAPFREGVTAALEKGGYDVIAYADSTGAWDALKAPKRIEILVTRMTYPDGQPNGAALARAARVNKRDVMVLFVGREQNREYADGLGLFMPMPAEPTAVAAMVEQMLAA